MANYSPIPLDEIRAARERISQDILRTPLIRMNIENPAEIYLKLENLQPIGSFKIRGASNAIRTLDHEKLKMECGLSVLEIMVRDWHGTPKDWV